MGIKITDLSVDEEGDLGFLHTESGVFVTDPTRSVCGRFEAHPQDTYEIEADAMNLMFEHNLRGHPDDADRDAGQEQRDWLSY